jgi:allantoinase
MVFDKLIKNGVIVTHESTYEGAVAIKDGKIAAIFAKADGVEAKEVIDAAGKYVMPGVIDGHVHPQDPGFTERDDFPHVTASAAKGGITTIVVHPLNYPPILDVKSFNENKAAYAGRAYVDYAIHGGASSESINDVEPLWNETGATSIKMFTCFSVAEFPFVKDDALYAVLEKLGEIDGLCLVHCENEDIIKLMEKRMKDAGRKDALAYNESRPQFGEVEAIRRTLYFMGDTGAKGVIVHISSAEGVLEVSKAKEEGIEAYAETCPHFLTFTRKDYERLGPFMKFSPVVRDEENKELLWHLLDEGHIDLIGSDHCPFTYEEKVVGWEDIWKVPNGIPGLEPMLPVLLNGVNEGRISLNRVVEVMSYNPAVIYGLAGKGTIEVGADADIIIVDMEKEHTYQEGEQKCKPNWSPYFGMTFKGWPVTTIVRGEVVYNDGEVKAPLGYGRFIQREK